jgi:site-specific recombinase
VFGYACKHYFTLYLIGVWIMSEEIEKRLAETTASLVKIESTVARLIEQVDDLHNKTVAKEADYLCEINELNQNPYAILCNMAPKLH